MYIETLVLLVLIATTSLNRYSDIALCTDVASTLFIHTSVNLTPFLICLNILCGVRGGYHYFVMGILANILRKTNEGY